MYRRQLWMLQENKAGQIFQKMNISYPLIRKLTFAYQGVNMFVFWKIWRALFSCNTRFEIRSIALLLKVFSIDLSQLGVCEFLENFEFFFRTNILQSISGY